VRRNWVGEFAGAVETFVEGAIAVEGVGTPKGVQQGITVGTRLNPPGASADPGGIHTREPFINNDPTTTVQITWEMLPRYPIDQGTWSEGVKPEKWQETGEGDRAEEREEFDNGPPCWASIINAPKIVRSEMRNETTLIHEESGKDFITEERKWSRWATD
jgi:hypothetical protein